MDQDKKKLTHEDLQKRLEAGEKIYIRRFDSYTRFLHLLVIVSFLTLAITGMVIKFSGIGVFQSISNFMGGYKVTGFLHRTAAIITFTYFFLHIFYILKKFFVEKKKINYMFSGENSMMPNLRDVKEFKETIKWFPGLGTASTIWTMDILGKVRLFRCVLGCCGYWIQRFNTVVPRIFHRFRSSRVGN